MHVEYRCTMAVAPGESDAVKSRGEPRQGLLPLRCLRYLPVHPRRSVLHRV